MGMRDSPNVEFDEEIVVLLMSMFQDMGNHIALQYAGSHLVGPLIHLSKGTTRLK